MLFTLQHNATSWDNGCQKRPLLTPFLTPVVPRRARVRRAIGANPNSTNSTKTIKSTKTHYTKNPPIHNRISRLNCGCSEVLTLLESNIAVVVRMDANNPTIDDFKPEIREMAATSTQQQLLQWLQQRGVIISLRTLNRRLV
jgi:hypothetical protein